MDKLTLRLNKVNKLTDCDKLKRLFACKIAISTYLSDKTRISWRWPALLRKITVRMKPGGADLP